MNEKPADNPTTADLSSAAASGTATDMAGPATSDPAATPHATPQALAAKSGSTGPTTVLLAPTPAGDGATEAYHGPVSVGSAPRASGSTPRALTPVPIAWKSWPVIDSVWELLTLSAVVAGVPAVVWSASRNLPMAAACGLVAAFSVWRQFVPTVYEINALGVTSRTLGRSRRIPWISIDRFVIGRKGVFLTSAGAPLEYLRGLYLPWGRHREQILGSLRYYLPQAEDSE